MSLLTVAEARARVNTSLTDDQLQDVIDQVEAEITGLIGPPQDDGNTVTHTVTKRGGTSCLFMPSEIGSVVSIVEDTVTLESTQYQIWPAGVIERLPVDWALWGGDRCVVTYKPADDRPKRKGVIIDLLRLDLSRTTMEEESIGGDEYSYKTAGNWDQKRREIMKRIRFTAV